MTHFEKLAQHDQNVQFSRLNKEEWRFHNFQMFNELKFNPNKEEIDH